MTKEEIQLLDSPQLRRLTEENLERSPDRIALDKRLPHASLIATQVKYLRRARLKLPSYYEARAILPPLAFEQASSEAAASRKNWHGDLCIDLTCGLGVDSLFLARRFRKVIAVERSPELALAARINFARLGAANIEVEECTAEDFMERFVKTGVRADLVYADPDRRSEDGRKLIRMEECSPDVTGLLPLLRRASSMFAVKLSPMFDVDETFRIFGGDCLTEAVSFGGECKEVLVCVGSGIEGHRMKAVAIGAVEASYEPDRGQALKTAGFRPPYPYMIIPDAALRKLRIVDRYAAGILPEGFSTPTGYIFAREIPEGALLGKVFEVADMKRYRHAELKKELRTRGIKAADIYVKDFPLSAPAIARQIGLREGGEVKLAFSKIEGELWSIELKEITLPGNVDFSGQ